MIHDEHTTLRLLMMKKNAFITLLELNEGDTIQFFSTSFNIEQDFSGTYLYHDFENVVFFRKQKIMSVNLSIANDITFETKRIVLFEKNYFIKQTNDSMEVYRVIQNTLMSRKEFCRELEQTKHRVDYIKKQFGDD